MKRRTAFFRPPSPEDAKWRLAQAQRRVMVQANCTADEAHLLMRRRADLARLTLDDIADGVNHHRMWFSLDRPVP
jgi:hypothetical protein